MKKRLINVYLDYVNNYLTVPCFAENYRMSLPRARRVLMLGAMLNERGRQ